MQFPSIPKSKELIPEDEENILSVFMFLFLHVFKEDFSFAFWPSQAQGQELFYRYAQQSVEIVAKKEKMQHELS